RLYTPSSPRRLPSPSTLFPYTTLFRSTQDLADPVHDHLTVARITRRARSDHPRPVRAHRDAVGLDRLGVFAQRTERAFQCFGGKGPGLVHVLSQAHDLHPPVGVHDLHLVTVDVYDVG